MPADQTGRLLITRRAIADIIRNATLDSYGVVALAGSPLVRLLGRLGFADPGIRVRELDGRLAVELDLVIGPGLPISEVARQVDAAVRHAIRRALDRELGSLAIHVEHLRFESGRRADSRAGAPRTRAGTSPPGDASAG